MDMLNLVFPKLHIVGSVAKVGRCDIFVLQLKLYFLILILTCEFF